MDNIVNIPTGTFFETQCRRKTHQDSVQVSKLEIMSA